MWNGLYKQSEKYWNRKYETAPDEMDTTPEAFTFTPTILGDKRAGKFLQLYRRNNMKAQPTAPDDTSKFVYIDIAFGED